MTLMFLVLLATIGSKLFHTVTSDLLYGTEVHPKFRSNLFT
jgi:hypothetical protein